MYQFKALPFGLSTSPFVFTSLMTVIATFLRRRAITLHPYLDDWLARNQNRRRLLEHRQFILSLINSLGLIINYEKSDLVPAQGFTFIGMEFLTHINIIRVPQARQMKILETVRMFSQKTSVSARDFLSLLGPLNAAADLVMLGRLHLRPLQMSLRNQWKPQKLSLCNQIGMTTEILQHLKWWLQEDLYHQGIPLRIDPPSHTIFTDASLSGWGAHVEPEELLFHGVSTEDQSRLHIYVVEMKAIFLSLSRAVHKVKNSTVLVSTDNTTVVAYIRHQGGTYSTELSEEVWNVLNLCLAHNIQLLAKHIPGRFNTLADRMSRIDKPISTELSLNQEIANKIFQIMDFPSIDLFATRLNHRLPLYVSPILDQKVLSIDALTMDWNHIHAYALPPFHLIPYKQSMVIPVQDSIDSAPMARQTMVSRAPRSVGISTGISASNSKPASSAKRQNSTSKPGPSTASRLRIVKQSLRDRQFSSDVAEHVSKARRDSTVKVYDAKWQIFLDWAKQRKIDPI